MTIHSHKYKHTVLYSSSKVKDCVFVDDSGKTGSTPFIEMFVLMNSSQREGQVEAGVMMSTHTGKDEEEDTKGAGVSSLLFSQTLNTGYSIFPSLTLSSFPSNPLVFTFPREASCPAVEQPARSH